MKLNCPDLQSLACEDEEAEYCLVTKEFFLPYRRGPKTVLLWEQVSTRQRRLATTALHGLAPARSARASAANHPESITACQHDDSVIANGTVTSKSTDHACPQHSCAPRGACGEQKSQRKQGALSASS